MLVPSSRTYVPNVRWPLFMLLATICLLLAPLGPLPLSGPSFAPEASPAIPNIAPDFGKLPLSFVPNAGQLDASVLFQTQAMGGTIFFQPTGVVLALPVVVEGVAPSLADDKAMHLTHPRATPLHEATAPKTEQAVVEMHFLGTNPAPVITGGTQLPGVVNYFIGNDPAQWQNNVPTYGKIVYEQLYAGIDLYYDGAGGQLKGTYIVAPEVDPSRIRWRYAGATSVRVDKASGDLFITLHSGANIIERSPIAWQDIGDRRIPVSASFAVDTDGRVGFALGDYNTAQPLTIDPILEYSTFLGGSGVDYGTDIVVDGQGNAYVIGFTESANFPTTNPLQSVIGRRDAYITKLHSSGTNVLFSTYFGGSNNEAALNIALDGQGSVYITGHTDSPDFPTANPLQPTLGGGSDAFITKLNANGTSLIFSTYLGGSNNDFSQGIAVDSESNVYVTGETRSSNFPIVHSLQPTLGGGSDAFITKLNANGTSFVFSTYLGGSSNDNGDEIVIDSKNDIYIVGFTFSSNFPTANPLQATHGGGMDAFITKLDSSGTSLIFSTYLGGSNTDDGQGITVDSQGNVYIIGNTDSSNFPVINALQPVLGGGSDVYIAKLNASGTSLAFSTYLGGNGDDYGGEIVIDRLNRIHIVGSTYSENFPIMNALQLDDSGEDVFVASFNSNGSDLLFSTYIGGNNRDVGTAIAVDNQNNVYVTAFTSSDRFPTTNPLQPAFGGGSYDAFIAKISFAPRLTLTAAVSTPSVEYCPTATSASPCPSLTYTITLAAFDGVVPTELSITLPEGLELVAGSIGAGGSYDAATRQVRFSGPVTPGVPVTITYQAMLRPAVPDGSPLITAVSATGAGRTIEQSIPVSVTQNSFAGNLILIYVSSDNDLSGAVLDLIDKAEQGAATPNTVTLLLLDGPGPNDTYLMRLQPAGADKPCPNRYGDPLCEGRYRMGQTIWPWPVDNLGDSSNLAAFLIAAQRAYPNAGQVILSLVGHGGGWSPPALGGQPSGHVGQPGGDPLGGMLWDNNPGSSLSTPELGTALRVSKAATERDIDLLFLDACNMAMAEVAYEVRDSARYLLASPNWKWTGFPYDRHLAAAGSGDILEIGQTWLSNEAAYMSSFADEPFTYSLVNLAEIKTIRERLDDLAQALMRPNGPLTTDAGRAAVLAAFATADRFDSNQDGVLNLEDNYIDLLSFTYALAAQFPNDTTVTNAANTLIGSLNMAIKAQESKSGTPWRYPRNPWNWNNMGGLSIYLPIHQDDWRRRYYGKLQFTQDGQWDEFLNAWWENRVPPNDPTCPPDCGLPPTQLSSERRLYLPLIRR